MIMAAGAGMPSDVAPAFATILADLPLLPDWESRYAYVLELARDLPPMSDTLKVEQNLVRGCTAQVWLVASWAPDDTLQLQLASDALLVQGLLAVVHAAHHGQPRTALATLDFLGLLAPTGLLAHLSPNRRNGLASVVARLQGL
jgi:cysteine desulfuration protein SufE